MSVHVLPRGEFKVAEASIPGRVRRRGIGCAPARVSSRALQGPRHPRPNHDRSRWVGGTRTCGQYSGKRCVEARTLFRVLRHDADGTDLLEARLTTGRTNQIHFYIWQASHPVLGDPMYLPCGQRSDKQTLNLQVPPLRLYRVAMEFRASTPKAHELCDRAAGVGC